MSWDRCRPVWAGPVAPVQTPKTQQKTTKLRMHCRRRVRGGARGGMSTDLDSVSVAMETALMFGQSAVRLVCPQRRRGLGAWLARRP